VLIGAAVIRQLAFRDPENPFTDNTPINAVAVLGGLLNVVNAPGFKAK